MMIKKYIIAISSLVIFFGCDKIETPINEDYSESLKDVVIDADISFSVEELNRLEWDTVYSPNNQNQQFILLQEFTGHQCFNCPPGTKEMLRLDDKLGDQLIPLSVHAGDFALPQPNNPDGSYSTDHRVKEIVEGDYLQKIGVSFFPTGLINNNGSQLVYSDWESEINTIKDDQPVASLNVMNLYNDSLKIIRSVITYEWLEDQNGNYNLQVFLSEDHVVDWQLDGSTDVENYDHRHMLRKTVNPLFGIATVEATAGNTGKKEYIYSPDPSWKVNDLTVIAYIHEASSPFSVVQVNAAPVIE